MVEKQKTILVDFQWDGAKYSSVTTLCIERSILDADQRHHMTFFL
jgi:hypothetical protein